MSIVKTIDLTCPNCEWTFSSKAIEGDEPHFRKRTDFQVKNLNGVEPLLYGVHLCERCGFAGPEAWFTGEVHVSYDVRQRVWDELAPKLDGDTMPTSEKYEFAARVASWDSIPPRQIADLWLRAAWCCVDERDTEAERYYRRHAARAFEEALNSYDGVDVDERAVLTYLVGELWRRIGFTDRARAWFAMVPSEVVDAKRQAWVVRWAKQQRDDPREWFS